MASESEVGRTPEERRVDSLLAGVRSLLSNTSGLVLESNRLYRLELKFRFDGEEGYAESVLLEDTEEAKAAVETEIYKR